MTLLVLGRIAVSLKHIAREFKRMNDLSEARYPVQEPPRTPRKATISHPTAREWNEAFEKRQMGL